MSLYALDVGGTVRDLNTSKTAWPNDLFKVADVSAITGIAIGWKWNGATYAAPTIAPPTQAQLAQTLVTAASVACDAVTSQIVPDQTHQIAYTNALAIVGPGATVPTADPAKTAFANMAAAFGFGSNLQQFATLAVEVGSASLSLSATLGALEAAAEAATTPTALATALATFETSLGSLVTTLNSAGLTVTVQAPAPINIPGI